MLLAEAARRMGIAEKLAAVIPDRRERAQVVHPLAEILLARILAIACGYEDADDLDTLRTGPAFKLACGRLPESGVDLMSQPTVSRWENTPTVRDLVRLGLVMVDLYCASYAAPPEAVVLDIDDTLEVVHGHQQLSLFNAHYDERCFLPIHVYDTATGRPVAMILRPGKTPSGAEVRGHIRRLVRAIRRHWPTTRITIRGDGHYCRPEVMDWCEANDVDYIFGLTGTKALADDIRVERAIDDSDAVRGFAETTHAAKSWKQERRVAARIEATRLGLDIRYVVTNIATGTAEWLYADLYCARGQAENLIKLHKAQLASDRTSCAADQMRLSCNRRLWCACRARRHRCRCLMWSRRSARLKVRVSRARPGPHRLRQRLPGRRPLPPPGRFDQARRALSSGASGPLPIRSASPTHSPCPSPRRGEKYAEQNRDRLHATTKPLPKSKPS